MTHMKSLGEIFSETARSNRDREAIVFPERTFTFDQLLQMVESFAFRFREVGVERATRVQLLATDHLVQLAGVLATSVIGAQLMLDPGFTDDDEAVRRFIDNPEGPWANVGAILIDGSWSPSAVMPSLRPPPAAMSPNPAEGPWVTATAMREDGPRAVRLSETAMLTRIGDVGRALGADCRLCSLSPLFSLTFLTRSLAALVQGGRIVVGQDPSAWERAGVTHVSGRPGELEPLVDQMRFRRRLPVVEIVGARPSDALVYRLLEHFEVIEDAYSTAETGVAHVNTGKLDAEGAVKWQGNQRATGVRIVDEAGHEVAKGAIGQVQIHPLEPLGQADPGESPSTSRWISTEDIAHWGEAGCLIVVGRSDDLINVLGWKVPGRAIDQIITSVNGILRAACFKNPKPGANDELFVYCVFEDGCNQMQAIASAKYKLGKSLGPAFVPRVFRQVSGIPTRPDGRAPDRRACAEFLMGIYRQRGQVSAQVS